MKWVLKIGSQGKQKIAKAGQMIIFKDDGEEVEISAPADSTTTTNNSALDILLIGGLPLNEPVARYGPFVMNTKEEILKAIEDYQNGNMGEIAIR
jgi:quercetin 2,3-dioxygenase